MIRRYSYKLIAVACAACWLAGCSNSSPHVQVQSPSPAKVNNGGAKEGDLATIKLTEQAEKRLGIETAPVEFGRVLRTRSFAGEAVLPAGKTFIVSSPVAGTLSGSPVAIGARVSKGAPLFRLLPLLSPQRDLRVIAEADLDSAKTRLDVAKLRMARAEQMLKEQVGTVRGSEDARHELNLAQTAYDVARLKLDQIRKAPLDSDISLAVNVPADGIVRQVLAAAGQQVAAGAALVEIADLSVMWIKVPIYTGDMPKLMITDSVQVENLGGSSGAARTASRVAAPPSADALSASVDVYYQTANTDLALRPGQKVSVAFAERAAQEALHVPRSAILYDVHGGAWLYENSGPRAFTRRRVDVQRVDANMAVLARGPKVGAKVVTAGAAELFGTEFGAGK